MKKKYLCRGVFFTPLPHNFSFYKLLLTFSNSKPPLESDKNKEEEDDSVTNGSWDSVVENILLKAHS